jgi:FtsZ-binding cell division protein ZapB
MDLQLEDTDTLNGLEERILRAVELVNRLKEENADLKARLVTAAKNASSDNAAAIAEAADAKAALAKADEELEVLRAERKQVKARIEKLLGQMDLLSAG